VAQTAACCIGAAVVSIERRFVRDTGSLSAPFEGAGSSQFDPANDQGR
jgi:hypothetical protein